MTRVVLAALFAVLCLVVPAGAAAQQPPPGVCEELVQQWRDGLNHEYQRYLDTSGDNVRSFRAQARQARRSRDRPLLRRAYRTAKRLERREAAGAAVRLGQAQEAYIALAVPLGCDPNALRADHGTLVALVGTTHAGRMRQLRRIHRRFARDFPR